MKSPSFSLLFFQIAICYTALSGGLFAHAQEAAPQVAAAQAPDAATLEARLKAVQENADLDEATKGKLSELYTQALNNLKSADESKARKAQFAEVLSSGEAMTSSLQEGLTLPLDSPSQQIPEGATSAEIEQRVSDADAALAAAQTERAALEQESAQRSERRRQIPELQAAARLRIAEAEAEITAAATGTDPPEVLEARRALALTRRETARQELESYDAELQSYDVRGRILALQLDGAVRRLEHLKREAALLREALAERRRTEALEAAARAREALLEANNAPPAIRDLAGRLAEENTRLTLERTGPDGLLSRIEAAGARLTRVKEQLGTQTSDFTALKAKVDAAGIGTGTGALLRTHQRDLEDARQLERNIRARQQEIAATQVEEIEIEEARRKLADVEALIQDTLATLPAETTEAQKNEFGNVLRTLYTNQREVLEEMIEDYETYFATLIDLDAQEQQLIAQTDEFQRYITERVLWLRSGDLISLDEIEPALEAWRWLADPENLVALSTALASDFSSYPLPVISYAFVILLLNAFRWHFRRRIALAAELAGKRGCMEFRPTLAAAVYSVLVSIGVPLLLGLIGWRCSFSIDSTEYTRAVGGALGACALYVWSFEFAREVLRPNGLGIAHFGWSESSCRTAARRIFGLELLATPLVVLFATLDIHNEQQWQETAGRFTQMLVLLLLAVFGHLMLRKRNGALLEIIERARKRSHLGLRRLWYTAAVFTPVVLMLASAYGYSYSVLQIATQIHYLLLCAFCLIVFVQLVLRWMLIARRQLARALAKKKLETLRESAGDQEAAPPPEEELDLEKIDTQAMRLIRSSFAVALAICAWWIWADDLPALNVLDRVELWSVTDTITTETTDSGGNVIRDAREQQVPITLRHVAAFLFIAGITLVAVQNLPGLLEILVWQRLSLMAGERYAANTIITYVLTLLGGTWAFSAVGLSWGKLQWLFAAVGLGLGFGLQEIFANLVSGIILLFERPVRVGDVVTVGGTSGTVSRIRIRATWITTFNRQELIVPNREFVTGQLINWTLSDRVLRIEMPIGIAYGSDIALAKRLMLEVANANEFIAEEPAPVVYFTGFGASSLDFELRAHCTDMDNSLTAKDQLLCGIDAAFRQHNIEIPFPQTDLNVRRIDGALRLEQLRAHAESPDGQRPET